MLKEILNKNKPEKIDILIIDIKNEEIQSVQDVDSLEHFLMKNDIDLKNELKIINSKYIEIKNFLFVNKFK